jgi:hypothetical protein
MIHHYMTHLMTDNKKKLFIVHKIHQSSKYSNGPISHGKRIDIFREICLKIKNIEKKMMRKYRVMSAAFE